jgi:hypothetical protein
MFLMAMNMNQPPPIGLYSRGAQAMWLDFDIIGFKKAFLEFLAECGYEVLKVFIRNEFIGSSQAQQDQNALSQLQKCKQFVYDAAKRSLTRGPVSEYYQDFTALVALLPNGHEFAINIGTQFYQGLDREVLQLANPKVKKAHVNLTTKLIPKHIGDWLK